MAAQYLRTFNGSSSGSSVQPTASGKPEMVENGISRGLNLAFRPKAGSQE